MEQSLLSLDLASSLGWAASAPGRKLAYGTLALPKTGEDVGAFLEAYWRWLDMVIEEWEPDWIVFESPLLRQTTTLATCRKLYGLASVTELIARKHLIVYREVNNKTVRKFFTGNGGGKRDEIKKRVMEACRLRGLEPRTDDEADALAIHSYAGSLLKIDTGIADAPLFAERVA